MKGKTLLYLLGIVVLVVLGGMFLRFELPPISVSAEHLPNMYLGPLPITNSLLTSWVVVILLIAMAYFATRNMQMVPSGLQNLLEWIVEQLYNITEGVSGPKWAVKFFIVPTTIFFYVLFSNWFGLIPGLGGFGFCEPHEVAGQEVAAAEGEGEGGGSLILGCQPGEIVVPIFRSPSADLNNTLMLALFTQVTAWVFGFTALGFGGFVGKFFVFSGIAKAFKPDEHGNKRNFKEMMGQVAFGFIETAVGLLEFLSEFVKIIAYTFRLFGNIFAGEVMLVVLTFLVPLTLALPSLGLEVFVGLVQAFVFFILSVAFYTLAVTPHAHEDEAH